MTTQYESHASTDPGSRSSAELEREVRQSRAEVEDTLDAIQDRLSPGQLFDQVTQYLRDNGGEFARNFGQIVRQNPVPAALVGVGLVWMMLGSRGRDGGSHTYDTFDPDWPEVGAGHEQFGSEAGAHAGEGLAEAGDRSWRAAKEAGGRMSRVAGNARERAANMGAEISQTARRTGAQARHYGGRAREGFFHVLQRQPLVLGALGLAAGAALGAALPATRREDELMGETSDDIKRRAWAAGREGYAKAGAAASAAYSAAGQEAKEQGLTGEGLASAAETVRHKFASVAEAATEAAKQEVDPEGRQEANPEQPQEPGWQDGPETWPHDRGVGEPMP
jgi:uncharacterized protein DUF3618